jgi:Ca2+-transporting ATPase
MGFVTFSLFTLFFSIATKDERRTAFSLDTLSDKTFVKATGISALTLIGATVLGPLQAFLDTTSLTVQQWLICTALAVSILVVSEIWKGIRRRISPAPAHHG